MVIAMATALTTSSDKRTVSGNNFLRRQSPNLDRSQLCLAGLAYFGYCCAKGILASYQNSSALGSVLVREQQVVSEMLWLPAVRAAAFFNLRRGAGTSNLRVLYNF
jgi:hypothetical protein